MDRSWQWWGGCDRAGPDPGFDPHGADGREIFGYSVSSIITSLLMEWVDKPCDSLCHLKVGSLSCCSGVVFIRPFRSWAGLRGFAWTALFVPWEEVEEGKNGRAEEIQTCLTSYFFFPAHPPLRETSHYLHFADLNLRSAGFSFQFLEADFWPQGSLLSASSP